MVKLCTVSSYFSGISPLLEGYVYPLVMEQAQTGSIHPIPVIKAHLTKQNDVPLG